MLEQIPFHGYILYSETGIFHCQLVLATTPLVGDDHVYPVSLVRESDSRLDPKIFTPRAWVRLAGDEKGFHLNW